MVIARPWESAESYHRRPYW